MVVSQDKDIHYRQRYRYRYRYKEIMMCRVEGLACKCPGAKYLELGQQEL